MKSWQDDDRFKKARKSNTPHFYLYMWFRLSGSLAFLINSIVVFVITTRWKAPDSYMGIKFICIVNIIYMLLLLYTMSSPTIIDFYFGNLIKELGYVGMMSIFYLTEYSGIIVIYIIELAVIIYWGIKIDKDNSVVDNNKYFLWWQQKKQEKYEQELVKWREEIKNRCVKVELTEEQKLKKMSRKERKEYKEKKNKLSS